MINVSNQRRPWNPEGFKRDMNALQKKLAKDRKSVLNGS